MLWALQEWKRVSSEDVGPAKDLATCDKRIEHIKGQMACHFLIWKSTVTRHAQLELRGARVLEEVWKHSAKKLSAFRSWHHLARHSARIKVSLSAGMFAFQRLVLGAWKLVCTRAGPASRQFATPRRTKGVADGDSTLRTNEKEKDTRSPASPEEPEAVAKMKEVNGRSMRDSRPRTLLEQLHNKQSHGQFCQPSKAEPRRGKSTDRTDRMKEHPRHLPTPNRQSSEPRREGPKERIARQTRGKVQTEEPLAQLRLKLQDLQSFSAAA